MNTCAPSAARSSAVARPMPVPPPVMTAVLSSKRLNRSPSEVDVLYREYKRRPKICSVGSDMYADPYNELRKRRRGLNMSDLTGKRALVTGGSRGIGAAIALELAEQGADVALTYERSADRAAEVVQAARATGRNAVAIQADSADPAAIKRSVAEAVDALGGLDILVNNAGTALACPIAETSV